MPLIGWGLGIGFAKYICAIDHWLALGILGYLGGKMIYESFKDEGEEEEMCDAKSPYGSLRMVTILAIATSIDALAVGITFAFLSVDIVPAVTFIGVVTFILSAIGVCIGNIFGAKYKSKAEFVGGAVLILLGIKILLEQNHPEISIEAVKCPHCTSDIPKEEAE